MNETPFEQFIILVEVDQKINALHKAISNLQQETNKNNELNIINQQSITKNKEVLHVVRKEVDAKELEMKILDQQEAEKKQRLDQVANHKEYQSLKAEIDQLKKAQHVLEDDLMIVWNRLETAKKEYDTALALYEQQQSQIEKKNTEYTEKIFEINQEIATLAAQTQEQEKRVPAEWLEKYTLMRSKVTDPVVAVVNNNCGACFYNISAQDMQFLKRRKLVQCKDCFRLLYLAEVHQELNEN